MKTSWIQLSAVIAAVVLTCTAWALIIWIGVIVTEQLLDTLHYIVELAQLTP